jgi:hypothetical protein
MNLPPIEIDCTVELLEDTPSGVPVVRPVIIIPVEGYNWISYQIAYYKSSGLSNAEIGKEFETLVRKFMWFPTIGLLTDKKTLISTLMAMTMTETTHHNPGYILKYPNIIFSKYGFKRGYQSFLNYFLRPPFTSVTPQYGMVSPYLTFVYSTNRERFATALTKIENKKSFSPDETTTANQLIAQFNIFLNVMCQYCYNWKQIQDSIRLSVGNNVNGVSLMQSELAPICLFILQCELKNEFDLNRVELVFTEKQLPFFKVNYVPEKVLVRTPDFYRINNEYLLYNDAINFKLIIEEYQGSDPTKDFRPYYETMYMGNAFPKALLEGGRRRGRNHRSRRTRIKHRKTKGRKQKINRKKTKRRF